MHRVAQLVGHLTARVSAGDLALAHEILPPSAWALFDAMPVADQRHGLDVTGRLLARGIDDREVLAAALLHDVAKGTRLRVWHRVGGVLLSALAPRALQRLATPDPASRGYPWHLFLHHAELSAQVARDAGLSERTAAFIRARTLEADRALAQALHDADEVS
ncbi:MAG TPA: hypothetical protein VKU35_02820 [Candidatus Limnocylindria bacterium]|nr:hypothetical protein [Candidatus Limnocylindria bacterium]